MRGGPLKILGCRVEGQKSTVDHIKGGYMYIHLYKALIDDQN